MSPTRTQKAYDFAELVSNLVTEDDTPVDNLYAAKQQRLLVEPIYNAWTPPPAEEAEGEESAAPRTFLADANVGLFFSVHEPPLVPDMFLSLDVRVNPEWIAKEHRSYFFWEFGKPPEVVVEVVSNQVGGELTHKLRRYAQMDITYYVVFDPFRELSAEPLRVYERGFGKRYRLRPDFQLPELGLQLTIWHGAYEAWEEDWLRWCDATGQVIPTGAESHQQQAQFAKQETERATREAERATRLAAKLRELGFDPEQI
ncbi:MAG: Uma2 family endonuclease [Acidobacteria bacterium]|nr:Uma2 family endonuclease [Acidobacteriota bacterium]MBI3426056.1 Uma2 family endonuclease [Acidobacteriota bacterium]